MRHTVCLGETEGSRLLTDSAKKLPKRGKGCHNSRKNCRRRILMFLLTANKIPKGFFVFVLSSQNFMNVFFTNLECCKMSFLIKIKRYHKNIFLYILIKYLVRGINWQIDQFTNPHFVYQNICLFIFFFLDLNHPTLF